jgi:hypothetical protein
LSQFGVEKFVELRMRAEERKHLKGSAREANVKVEDEVTEVVNTIPPTF